MAMTPSSGLPRLFRKAAVAGFLLVQLIAEGTQGRVGAGGDQGTVEPVMPGLVLVQPRIGRGLAFGGAAQDLEAGRYLILPGAVAMLDGEAKGVCLDDLAGMGDVQQMLARYRRHAEASLALLLDQTARREAG